MPDPEIEQLAVNVIRGLAMDAPQAAVSGHPGTAMALAPLAHVLFTRVLRHDPADPHWPDRDRFVLSAGHASILLYSMLYLCGYGLTLEDLKAFRQWGSLTPGHPETGHTVGVEATTGPLGQGIAHAVGMAIAERRLRAKFGPSRCDHHIYAICSDGDFMEGISHETASLAGHLKLGHLVAVYDDNHITIDGATELAYTDDVPGRFRAYGWHVDEIGEVANELDTLEAALLRARAVADQPSLIVLRSHIGWPSPHFTDTKEAHGDPLGDDEIRETKAILGLPDEPFYVPDSVHELYRELMQRGAAEHAEWNDRRVALAGDDDHDAYESCLNGEPLTGWAEKLPTFEAGSKMATRKAINAAINATAPFLPGLVAGAGDLTGNTGVSLADGAIQDAGNPGGNQVHYGIREHAMAAAMSGMALHGGVLPVGGTFFIFSDYMRPSVRLAALQQAHVVYSWTHDSIGLGQDGPTHQPIEHLASLRAMPGLRLIRPADANECAQAWRLAVEGPGPTGLVLTRQDLPVLAETGALAAEGVARGAYVLKRTGSKDRPDLVLVGTGSEVQHCSAAADALSSSDGLDVQVVSMPSWGLFEKNDERYKESVLPVSVPTLAVEAGSSFGWDAYADEVLSIDRFGASAPGNVLMEKFGFTAAEVERRARALLGLGSGTADANGGNGGNGGNGEEEA